MQMPQNKPRARLMPEKIISNRISRSNLIDLPSNDGQAKLVKGWVMKDSDERTTNVFAVKLFTVAAREVILGIIPMYSKISSGGSRPAF